MSEVAVARTHVVMSDEVLRSIDEVVGKRGRSRFLEEAAREKLERLELVRSIEASAGVARGAGYQHWRDGGSAAEWVRDTRRTESAG
jgi:metal-responsive CopG/Arc/MetJ family transcriptional regulator